MTDLNQLTQARGTMATSKPLSFKVVSKAANYPAPKVLEAPNDTLDPIDASNGATVRVQYEGMQTTDILAVAWTGSSQADTWESEQKFGSAFGHVDFAVPVSVVAASQGKIINVRYAVVRNGQPGKLSEQLPLEVGELPQDELLPPEVVEAKGDVLDLADFEGNATVRVKPWKLIAVKQRYWLLVTGTLESGTEYTFYLANGVEVRDAEVGAGVEVSLARSEMEKLADDSQLLVTMKVAFDGGTDESKAKAFESYACTLKREVIIDFIDFEDAPQGRIPAGTTLDLGAITITSFQDFCSIDTYNRNFPPHVMGKSLQLNMHEALARIILRKKAKKITLGAVFAGKLSIYTEDDKPGEVHVFHNMTGEFITLTDSRGIKYIMFDKTVQGNSAGYIDNITISY